MLLFGLHYRVFAGTKDCQLGVQRLNGVHKTIHRRLAADRVSEQFLNVFVGGKASEADRLYVEPG
jgi:hypothetical protein